MVKSSDSGVAPFLKKCYEMVDDESTNSIISWSQTNDSFVIWDLTEFSVHLLPKYFKHSNSSSFVRQLNIYGFRKIDTDHWEFANDGFIRGQKHLLKNISRRKNSQGTDNRKSVQQQDNSIEHHETFENVGIWKEVESLKTGKIALAQELVKLRQHQETADNKLLLLRDQLQGMEKNQQQMLSFLVMAMQKSPGFLAQLLHKKENNWRMAEPGSIVEQVADDAEPLASEGMIVRYQPPVDETFEPIHAPPIGPENPQESKPSSDGVKDFFFSPDFMELLMDENLGFDNHAPFVLPELADDGAWEQLLLANPFVANIEDSKTDYEEPTDAETDTETAVPETQLNRSQDFENLIEQMEKSYNLENQATVGTVTEPSFWLCCYPSESAPLAAFS
ncbi:Heat shock factor protein [Salix suchowensis]|nr:Heat shock factor protein [Salix suchowensis]